MMTGMKEVEIQLIVLGIFNKEKITNPYMVVVYNTVQSFTSAIEYLKITLESRKCMYKYSVYSLDHIIFVFIK